ncbi:hypothetical protein [Deinococcus humi]|uniref:Uncharacterized protein n=1 Tax=Deinococcus humi TaxID=662880 RepID=A0A7W8JW91_9DEIO|nr:hypothetical protein [Deinococcus humi]MBB5363983.1 hypothetical protein [Deinococcus humi]
MAVAALMALGAPQTAELTPVHPNPTACTPVPTPSPIYAYDTSSVMPTPAGFRLNGNAVLELQVCKPGTLTMKATGEAAGGSGPRLLVSMGEQDLLSQVITGTQTLNIPIPEQGRVYLSYLNDYLKAEQRSVFFANIVFSGNCIGLSGKVSPSTDWRDPFGTAFLSGTRQMTIRPCGSGQLLFHTVSTAVDGTFPVLKITGATPESLPIKAADEDHRLTLKGETTLTISNPAYRLIEDRNLILEDIQVR